MFSEIVDPMALRRPEVEAFIRERYWQAYQASVDNFPKNILVLFSGNDRPVAAAGLRGVADGFFSERYLDEPIDQVVTRATGLNLDRSKILEISNLACASSHVVFPFMLRVLSYGRENRYSCGVFTATSGLRRLFQRLHLPLISLATASPQRVEDADRWGTYYGADPQVCVLVNPTGAPTELFPRCNLIAAGSSGAEVDHG